VVTQFEQYIKLNKKIAPKCWCRWNQIEEPSKLADTVASHLKSEDPGKAKERLNCIGVSDRLEKAFAHMETRSACCSREEDPRPREAQMEKTQREYYLNEQLEGQFQKELGEGEDGARRKWRSRNKITAVEESARARTRARMCRYRAVVRTTSMDLSIPVGKKSSGHRRRLQPTWSRSGFLNSEDL